MRSDRKEQTWKAISSVDLRRQLVDALLIDRIGAIAAFGGYSEIQPERSSRWYLTGFLAATAAAEGQQGLEFEDG